MKPYYERDGVTLYCGDARDVLGGLARESVELIVTDPPYGVGYSTHKPHIRLPVLRGDESRESARSLLDTVMPLACAALRRSRHLYVFGRWDLSSYGVLASCELIWDKGNRSGGDWSSPWGVQHEYIQFGVLNKGKHNDGAGVVRLRKGSVLRVPRNNSSAPRRHPTEKPVLLLRELIESSSRIGETVLDPFAGSGSTLVAALIEGRRAIGIEIEERYCEIAAKRLERAVLPLEASA